MRASDPRCATPSRFDDSRITSFKTTTRNKAFFDAFQAGQIDPFSVRLKFVIRDASRWIIVHVSSRNRENLFLKRWSRNCYCYLPFHVPVLIPLPVVVPSLTFKFLNIALTMVLNIKEILRKWMLTGNLYDNFSKFFFFFFFSFCVYYKSDIYKLRSKVCFQSVEIEFRGETNDVSR